MASAKPLLWMLPTFVFVALTLAVASYRGQELTDLQWLVVRSLLASAFAMGVVKFSIPGRGIMGIEARWERALVRWTFLLAVTINVLPCFVAMSDVAHMLHLGAAASRACAVVAVAVHLYLGWVAIFGV